ncbi:MAG: hypothetical protein JW982_05440 [Spirochaetes bacterium]|nr:hypothetical protein [Spirochaetota bacterium]
MEVQNITGSDIVSSTMSVNSNTGSNETANRTEEVSKTENVADNSKGKTIDSYA